MKNRDFLVTADGQFQVCQTPREWDLLRNHYRLHRFITEVEDVVERAIGWSDDDTELDTPPTTESEYLSELRLLTRRLIMNCYWVHTQIPKPCPDTGISVQVLYDELGFPLTVQTVNFFPGATSTIHNHVTWGVIAVLKGEEKNTFWRRIPDPKSPDRVEAVSELTLLPGDIISFTPDAIHSVEAVTDEPTITFSLYGETHHSKRFEFDPILHTSKNF
jgi:predicted metal-dependent enzyme (double-stranded beta helix superfamily)